VPIRWRQVTVVTLGRRRVGSGLKSAGVGVAVGLGVGSGVGSGVGMGVGSGVGTGVGMGVGSGVGVGEGVAVGTGCGGCGGDDVEVSGGSVGDPLGTEVAAGGRGAVVVPTQTRA
jgi:hypothetical protein